MHCVCVRVCVVQWLTELAVKAWDTEVVPKDWLKQLTVPLYKKGAFDRCDNFRVLRS